VALARAKYEEMKERLEETTQINDNFQSLINRLLKETVLYEDEEVQKTGVLLLENERYLEFFSFIGLHKLRDFVTPLKHSESLFRKSFFTLHEYLQQSGQILDLKIQEKDILLDESKYSTQVPWWRKNQLFDFLDEHKIQRLLQLKKKSALLHDFPSEQSNLGQNIMEQ